MGPQPQRGMRSARLQIDHRRAAEVLLDGVKPAAITSRVTHEWVGLVGGTHGPWDRGPSATQCLSMWLPAWPHCAGPTASDPLPLSLIAYGDSPSTRCPTTTDEATLLDASRLQRTRGPPAPRHITRTTTPRASAEVSLNVRVVG